MIKQSEVYKIGTFNKPHGIHGELLFTFTDDVFDRVEADYIIVLIDGILVPFFIESYRFRSDTTVLLQLEGIHTAEQARRFTNMDVYFPTKLTDETEEEILSWEFFKGFTLKDVHHGHLGEIVDVDTSTMNTLFVVDYNGEELLVPVQEELVEGYYEERKEIIMCLPDGLL